MSVAAIAETDLFAKSWSPPPREIASRSPAPVSAPAFAELDYGVDERDWGAMKMLLDEFERELSERRTALLARLSIWKMAVRIFKRCTAEKMILRDGSRRDSDYHKAILGFLKGTGLLLQGELQRHQEIDPQHIGVRFEDFAGAVTELEYQEREWYGDMTEDFRNQILADVFGSQNT